MRRFFVVPLLAVALGACGGEADGTSDNSEPLEQLSNAESGGEEGLAEQPTSSEAPDAIARVVFDAVKNAGDKDVLGVKLGMTPEQVDAALKEADVERFGQAERSKDGTFLLLEYGRRGTTSRPEEEIYVVYSQGKAPRVLALHRTTKYLNNSDSIPTPQAVETALASNYGEPTLRDERAPRLYYAHSGAAANCDDFAGRIRWLKDTRNISRYDGCADGIVVEYWPTTAGFPSPVVQKIDYVLTDPKLHKAGIDGVAAFWAEKQDAMDREAQQRVDDNAQIEM